MGEVREKKAYVYQARVLVDGEERPGAVEWDPMLKDLSQRPLKECTFEDVIYRPVAMSNGNTVLGIHVPLNTDFMTRIDATSNAVTDWLSESDEPVARSTALIPVSESGHFAYARGVAGAPSHTKVLELLNQTQVLDEGQHWIIRPVIDRSQLDTFLSSQRSTEFSSKFPVEHDLLTLIAEQDGIFGFGRDLSDAIGASLEVDLTVRLMPEYAADAAAQSRFFDAVKSGLSRMLGRDSNATARAINENDAPVSLSLVPHKLALTFDVVMSTSEKRSFTDLCEGLDSKRADILAALAVIQGDGSSVANSANADPANGQGATDD